VPVFHPAPILVTDTYMKNRTGTFSIARAKKKRESRLKSELNSPSAVTAHAPIPKSPNPKSSTNHHQNKLISHNEHIQQQIHQQIHKIKQQQKF
jgi:hypothetical protein